MNLNPMSKTNEKENKEKLIIEERAFKNHESLINIQQSESRLHWQRNNIFLIVTSIFLLSFSQLNEIPIRIILCICGIVINITWLIIQNSSSILIHKWIKEARELENKFDLAPIFSKKPKPKISIRKIVYIFPIVFILLWSFLLCFLIVQIYS